ncbi:uncharacterized protein LOC113855977 [Abrus precatorius]|uniref:Uncharacterized protein LOC113855977 n=1 Tax=Abrus precatorius TaxID=3816 RepID=A0A8B8KI05_ABRPR|nr:uncharacterized protein LOC113855977 [Abrus precatorius]
MDVETPFTALAPPVFDGEGYHVWAAKMEAYLEANDLWEAVEEDYELLPLPANPTMAQIKSHKEKKSRKSKARASLFAAVSSDIFLRIMAMKSAFEVWNFLKGEYEGNERIKGMKVLNLIREFEVQHMKESETVKEYFDKLLKIANHVRLLGSDFPDSRIVQKVLVTIPERFEATIASLENSKDLSKISLTALMNALQAQEQRRMMRSEGSVEGALAAKASSSYGGKAKKFESYKKGNSSFDSPTKSYFSPCKHCGRENHPPWKCWRKPDQQCEKCLKMGHHQKICKSNSQQKTVTQENVQQKNVAQVADEEEQQLFVATCFAASNSNEKWLIDSGCTNHMTFDRDLFKELDTSIVSKVTIGNGEKIAVKGK